jgi:ankyrin repeat protein
MLLGKGADVNQLNTDRGRTALQIAAYKGQAAVVRILLAAGAKIWVESQGLSVLDSGFTRAAVIEMKRSIDPPS